jgi:hypothetical protein
MKTHLAVSKVSPFGGTLTTTLCGNMSGKSVDGMNSGEGHSVTCKNCLKIMADKKHWRYRKYLVPKS